MVDKQSALNHSQRNILVAAVLAVVLVSSGVYVLLSLPPHRGSRVSAVFGPLEFSLQLEKKFFVKGENISISISLRNISNQSITMWWSSYGSGGSDYTLSSIFPGRPYSIVLDFAVLDEHNWTLITLIVRRNLATISRTLAPNETATATYLWSQEIYNLLGKPSIMPAPAGIYYIKAFSERMSIAGWNSFPQPETPSVPIEILRT